MVLKYIKQNLFEFQREIEKAQWTKITEISDHRRLNRFFFTENLEILITVNKFDLR